MWHQFEMRKILYLVKKPDVFFGADERARGCSRDGCWTVGMFLTKYSLRKVPRLNVLQTNQKYPAISNSNCKPRSSAKVHCDVYTKSVRSRRPGMWATGKWFHLQDNARPHTDMSVKEFLSAFQIAVLPHASYFPNLPHWDFFLFPRLKRSLEDHPYACIQAIQTAVKKSSAEFQKMLSRTASKTSRKARSGVWLKEEGMSKEMLSTWV